MKYTIGIDFGTLSARAVVADPNSGAIVGECTFEYPHGVMDSSIPCGAPLPPAFALQHPDDYLLALKQSISGALASAGLTPDSVCALGIDFTSCTVVAHKADGTPMCRLFPDDPHAYVKLWKHHGAQREADDLYAAAVSRNEPWLQGCGCQVSSEWLFPKVLETYRRSPELYAATDRFSEGGDWLSLMLTGKESHSAPFAGNKAFYTAQNGYPSPDFFESVERGFGDVVGTKVCPDTVPVASAVGLLDACGAQLSGLPVGTVLCAPQLDAHVSLLSLGITAPGTLMLILGTSGCYVLHHDEQLPISGICASVKDGVIPGLCTYEAGIVSCGDHLDWFVKNCVPEGYTAKARALGVSVHKYLRDKAKKLSVGQSGLVALNWFNGNRCPLSDSDLSGLVVGMTLTTRPEEIYRALIEGVVFQTAIIIDGYKKGGISVNDMIASGGIAQKDDMLMQMLADVTATPIRVANDSQTAALGAAIYAATAAGLYPSVTAAASAMSIGADTVYTPDPERKKQYDKLFAVYKQLHDNKELHQIMHTLKKARS